ncbi:Uncharacterized mitochondrial protein AtMg00310 [Linum perenne]
MSNPELLLSRVIKGRYFHKSDFFPAKLGYRPSYGWRSILHGRDVLIQGMRWQIGNGRTIRMFKDPWMPNFPFASPYLNINDDHPFANRVVAELISMNLWNIPKLKEMFPMSDVFKILSIPLPLFECEDKIS